MKIATWNVNSLRVRLPHVLQWLAAAQPDVLAIQETKTVDEQFPLAEIEAAGYQAVFAGQKTYNGVAILSKSPATEIVTDIPGLDDPQRRILAATIDGIRVVDLYVVNGSEVGSDKYAYKLDWLAKVTAWLQQQAVQYPKLVVLGDFNIAPEDRDVHDPAAWAGQILCSAPERTALQAIQALGLSDVFRQFEQAENSFSWWDYRAAGFRRNLGLRIDLILASQTLADACTSCVIDREPRTWEKPSDHTPVIAEFVG
ncbi:MAG TPA: exodeoxyribonuclease III [Candidatus Thiothrix moscowensis]|uniref:exodeoxyribonuclease III n=1 Tax=unclassified Thiothrix TaxID=2636184 RepID=UPI0025FDD4C8|nr:MULTISPECIES: exodeoxyribonuclease III [unclassified Thiothrix]HRJ51919.1 exodeoxyribonuclease III [Candidatus Thiothrix moscowensis]HRJ92234.1 exodeoxyribonuclease III [Candidatus Thiothrix moscowensis]